MAHSVDLLEVVRERDEALAQLARARAELAALRLQVLSFDEAEPKAYPAGTTPGAPPLRYELVDAVHARVQPVIGLVRSVLGRKRDE